LKSSRTTSDSDSAKAEGPTWKQEAVTAISNEYAKLVSEVFNVPKGTCDMDLQMMATPSKRITWAEIVRMVRPALEKDLRDQIEAARLRNGRPL
jgi:hypothetical protein